MDAERQHDLDPNVAVVERWLATFDGGWPTVDDFAELLCDDARFVEHPNLVNAAGGERDRAAMLAGIEAGRSLLAWQRFEPLGHVASGDSVVTRMRWSGELAIAAGPWPRGTQLVAWCSAHYRLRNGRIAHVEQFDCYEQPLIPK